MSLQVLEDPYEECHGVAINLVLVFVLVFCWCRSVLLWLDCGWMGGQLHINGLGWTERKKEIEAVDLWESDKYWSLTW